MTDKLGNYVKKFGLLALLLPLAACSTYRLPMDTREAASPNHSYYSVIHTAPKFTEETIGVFVATTVATWLASSAGAYTPASQYAYPAEESKQALVSASDPALKIRSGFEKAAAQSLRWRKTGKEKADYKLEVGTLGWGIRYHGIKVARYTIDYSGYAAIEENKTEGSKQATFWCSYRSSEEYKKEDIYANGGQILKRELQAAADSCIRKVSKELAERIKEDSSK